MHLKTLTGALALIHGPYKPGAGSLGVYILPMRSPVNSSLDVIKAKSRFKGHCVTPPLCGEGCEVLRRHTERLFQGWQTAVSQLFVIYTL